MSVYGIGWRKNNRTKLSPLQIYEQETKNVVTEDEGYSGHTLWQGLHSGRRRGVGDRELQGKEWIDLSQDWDLISLETSSKLGFDFSGDELEIGIWFFWSRAEIGIWFFWRWARDWYNRQDRQSKFDDEFVCAELPWELITSFSKLLLLLLLLLL